MKVLINASSARQGGGQTYLNNLLAFPPATGEAQIFVLAPASLQLPQAPNIERVSVDWPLENPYVRAVWEKTRLAAFARDLDADILFCPGGIVGARAPRGCRTVTMFRNMIPFDLAQRRRYPPGLQRVRNWILERVMLESMLDADLVIFISAYAHQVIENRAPGRLPASVIIPHGINAHFRVASATALPRPAWLPIENYLLYVSTLDFYKAQLEVVRGYALLRQQRPTREKLILAGPENPAYARQVRAEVARLGLTDDVILAGSIPYRELPAVYHHAAINIFASESENCPNILLEALAAGRPIVCSSRQPMPEFGGDAVLYFDPASPAELAARLRQLIDDAGLQARLSDRARMQAAHFDWQVAARQTWDALAQAVAQKARA